MCNQPTFTLLRDSLQPWLVHCLWEFKPLRKKEGQGRTNPVRSDGTTQLERRAWRGMRNAANGWGGERVLVAYDVAA
jgi:hypothetical protein